MNRQSSSQLNGGTVQVGQTIIEKQVGQTVTQVPSSASSRPSRPTSRGSIPGSAEYAREYPPTVESVQEASQRDAAPPVGESADPRYIERSPFESLFSQDAQPQMSTVPQIDADTPTKTKKTCLDCGRLCPERPPGGICDDCFSIHRRGLPSHHCLAYCDKCLGVVNDVVDALGRATCANCAQVVEPTCDLWRRNRAPAQQSKAYHTQVSSQNEDSPVGRIDAEPPRVEQDLSALLAGLGERPSDSPLEPTVAAALAASVAFGIPDSPMEPLTRIPKEIVRQVSPNTNVRTRLENLQQEIGIGTTGNMVSDVRILAGQFGIPFTTLTEVIENCEALVGSSQRCQLR